MVGLVESGMTSPENLISFVVSSAVSMVVRRVDADRKVVGVVKGMYVKVDAGHRQPVPETRSGCIRCGLRVLLTCRMVPVDPRRSSH